MLSRWKIPHSFLCTREREKKLLKRVLADFVRIRIAFIFHLLHIIYVYFDQWTMTYVITAILELYWIRCLNANILYCNSNKNSYFSLLSSMPFINSNTLLSDFLKLVYNLPSGVSSLNLIKLLIHQKIFVWK